MNEQTQTAYQTVHIVDDDEAVRDSLNMLLKSVGYTVQLHHCADDFLEALTPDQSGCVVLDVRMPGMSGLELQQKLNNDKIEIPIIFITGHGDVPMAVQAMQAGAYDFLQKPFRDQELLDKINEALAIDTDNKQRNAEKRALWQRYESLTPREKQVMGMVAAGKPNKVIAIDLDLSQRTVEIHRARVMEKMNVQSVAELVTLAITIGQTQTPSSHLYQ